jgi:hypothetical protein
MELPRICLDRMRSIGNPWKHCGQVAPRLCLESVEIVGGHVSPLMPRRDWHLDGRIWVMRAIGRRETALTLGEAGLPGESSGPAMLCSEQRSIVTAAEGNRRTIFATLNGAAARRRARTHEPDRDRAWDPCVRGSRTPLRSTMAACRRAAPSAPRTRRRSW